MRPGERTGTAVLLAPYAAGALLLVAIPAVTTFGLAFFDYDLLTPAEPAGLSNFADLVSDERFHRALAASLIFVSIAVPLRLAGALALALLLHRRFRGVGAARTAAYLPAVVPEAAYALVWLFIFNPLYGPLNWALRAVGLPEPGWLTTPTGAMAAVILMSLFTIGEGLIVAIAARQEVPDELYQLAAVEGSGPLDTFRRVTMPLMAPTLALLACRDTAFSLQATFVPALLVTEGGPGTATTFLPLLIYETAFVDLRYGYAASMTLTMFATTGLLVALQYRLLRGRRFGFLS